MATTEGQDPVLEEEQRKDEKPRVSLGELRRLVRAHWGRERVWEPNWIDRIVRFGRPATRVQQLNSYDDANFLYHRLHVVKFYNGVESRWPDFIDAQAQAMAAMKAAGILTCEPVPTKDGGNVVFVTLDSGKTHAMRVLSFIPGKILGDIEPSATLLESAGRLVGKVDKCLAGESLARHAGFRRNHFWDLKHSLRLREFVQFIQGDARRQLVGRVLSDFETKVLPLAPSLQEAVIHNDANDQNILVSEDGRRVIGILDWGDMVRTWRVNEIAISMAYIMLNKRDILRDASLLLRGYAKECLLSGDEVQVLRTLVACRLACSATMSAYSASKDPTNEYLLITQEPGWEALEAFMAVPEEQVTKTFSEILFGT
mmetsp:Transcript_28360/g.59849  ORF Transcript_28360/g.59849 Transcript_28360/m.59849 type:complete len:371 (+) Transcript_28360:39-1151(+)